jgi:putative ABC transport system permease protein
MRGILQDLRYGFRRLTKSPGFSAVVILTLALGIGLNASIFSVVSAVILRPLPYPNPEQLVGLGQWRQPKGGEYAQTGVSAPNIVDITSVKPIFQQVACFRWSDFNITDDDHPKAITGIKASLDLLPMFGVRPLLGRFFSPEEMQAGHDQVAIIGYGLWQRRYAADPAVLGRTIHFNKRPYTIVAVMPASFRFTWDEEMDVFVPLVLTPEELSEAGRETTRDLQTQARLQPHVSVAQAQAAMDTLASNLAKAHPAADEAWGIKVEPLHAAYYRHKKTPLLLLQGAVLLVLLIACANVANLLLARASGRRREVAIRSAVGATRRRVMAQLLTESVLLATIGGIFGLVLTYAADRLLTLEINRYWRVPNAKVIDIDWRVVVFSLGVIVATGIVFGLAPALATSKTTLSETLKASGVNVTAEPARRHLHDVFVVSELALALVLLTGAGLLVRSFTKLMAVDLGIDATNVVITGVSAPQQASATQQSFFFQQLLQRVSSTPGVKSAGVLDGGAEVFFRPEDQPPSPAGQEPTARFYTITADFFRAAGTALLAGREFATSDTQTAPPVAIVSETLARRYWAGSSPVGRHLTLKAEVYSGQTAGSAQPLEIVGVVKDIRIQDPSQPQVGIYVPLEQHPVPGALLAIRTTLPSMSMVPALRNAVLADNKEQPLDDVKPMSEIVSEVYSSIGLPLIPIGILATLALVLSTVGVFGVMAYSVSRRTQEMAIRMALGAEGHDVLWLVLREGIGITLTGVAVGLVAGLGLGRVLADLLYGVRATDPPAFAAAALLLVLVALLACYIPARRATKVDPMVALRYE